MLAGFFYNMDIFNELGLRCRPTGRRVHRRAAGDQGQRQVRAARARLGRVAGSSPITASTASGPAYWKGEEGRLGLIDGTKKLTDPEFVAAFAAFDDLEAVPARGPGEPSTYADMTQLFTLGKAAILPDGSWDINQVTSTGLNVGVFGPPPVDAGGQRYLQEMPDMAHRHQRQERQQDAAKMFLDWVSGAEFQQLYVNTAPGFFAMSTQPVTYENKLAQDFADLKTGAKLTPRLALDRLSAGTPPLDDEIWRLLQVMMTTDTTPEQVDHRAPGRASRPGTSRRWPSSLPMPALPSQVSAGLVGGGATHTDCSSSGSPATHPRFPRRDYLARRKARQ